MITYDKYIEDHFVSDKLDQQFIENTKTIQSSQDNTHRTTLQSFGNNLRSGYNFLAQTTTGSASNITNKVSSGITTASAGIQKGLAMTVGRTVNKVVDTGKENLAAIIEQNVCVFDEFEKHQMTEQYQTHHEQLNHYVNQIKANQ